MVSPPPLSVYVHLPWCLAKCPYCDFNSHVAPSTLPQERYIDCLLEDLDLDLPHVAGREVQSVFFGGGTPSLFAPESIGRFLSALLARVAVASDLEVTLEANPGALEHGRFAGYRDAGVTRISLGVQSFDDAQLKRLGRIHDSAHTLQAVSELRAAGFENFNLDLMYGLPEQSLADAKRDLQRAIELQPTHLSHYQLTMEPGTVFYHRRPTLPDDELTWEMQQTCQALLADNGFEQYEVSAYARRGRRCRHNLNYWQFGDYLGVGAGAHGKWTEISTSGAVVTRTLRIKQPREYLATEALGRLTEQRIAAAETPFEFALNALRLNDGFAEALFESRTGLSIETIRGVLHGAERRGLLARTAPSIGENQGGGWLPTELGRRFLNDVQALFL